MLFYRYMKPKKDKPKRFELNRNALIENKLSEYVRDSLESSDANDRFSTLDIAVKSAVITSSGTIIVSFNNGQVIEIFVSLLRDGRKP